MRIIPDRMTVIAFRDSNWYCAYATETLSSSSFYIYRVYSDMYTDATVYHIFVELCTWVST